VLSWYTTSEALESLKINYRRTLVVQAQPGGSQHPTVWDQTLQTLVHGYPEGLTRPVRTHTLYHR
jgi:hypothetical protein